MKFLFIYSLFILLHFRRSSGRRAMFFIPVMTTWEEKIQCVSYIIESSVVIKFCKHPCLAKETGRALQNNRN